MAKVKAKMKGNLPVPQNREEAAKHIRMIGDAQRAAKRIETEMNDQIAKIKESREADAAPFLALVEALTEGVRTWCDANREALTEGNKRKFAELGTGRVEWRSLPASVKLKKGVKVEEVLAAIKRLKLPFVRTKEEIDREAMLRAPDDARKVAGVTIGSEGETFAVEPFEAQIEGRAA